MNTYLRLGKIVIMITVTLLIGPLSAQTADVNRSESTRTETRNGETTVHHKWNHSSGDNNFNVEVRGKIEVTDDDKDVKSLSKDGYLQITKTVFGSKRSVVIESAGNGNVSKEYYEGRTKMEWQPNGATWLGEILPEVVRTTTLSAETRVNRIYAKDGVQGMLNELAKLQGDHTRAHYAKLLLDKNIPSNELPNVINKIAELISSDYYLSTVFQHSVEKMLATRASSDAFFQGTKKINSDYYKSVVLKEGLKKSEASPAQVKIILQAASGINSDYYLSNVLTSLLDQNNVKDESLNELVLVSKKIPSDYYRTQVLGKAIEKNVGSKVVMKSVVDAVADVGSDHYKTQVFKSMAERTTMDPDVQVQVITLVGTSVGSEFYASDVLKVMLDRQKLSEESFKQLVNVGGELNSSNYASDVLKKAGKKDLSKKQLIELMEASKNINSDHYLTEVLMNIAPQVKASDDAVKNVYRAAAKKINSESYYGRVLKAID